MKELPSPGAIIRDKLNLTPDQKKVLDKYMELAGFPKSLNSFPLRLARLDKAMAACKRRNLSPDARIAWMKCLACEGIVFIEGAKEIGALLKASVSQARKAAGRKGLLKQGSNPDKKRTKAKKNLAVGKMPEICD